MSKTTLHTINKAPSDISLWQSCIAALQPGDALLLIENGVYAALEPELANGFPSIFYLKPDVEARGLLNTVPESLLVDDAGFVNLSCTHHKVVSWF